MLDRQKLLAQLSQFDQEIFAVPSKELSLLKDAWSLIKEDLGLSQFLKSKKWSILVPSWQKNIGQVFDITPHAHPYQVLAVDGSQIYYDRHQGPACYLINVGTVFLSYGLQKSSVELKSTPCVIMSGDGQEQQSAEIVNGKREDFELSCAVDQASRIVGGHNDVPFVCMFDGTLIFSPSDGQSVEKEKIFKNYMNHLENLRLKNIVHVGYISFPKSKELINVLRLVMAEYDEKKLDQFLSLNRLTDMDVAQIFLKKGQRSIVFESKAIVSYLYPKDLKPYFCYVHVGSEIVRLEFPAWIAQNLKLVDLICSVAFDQVIKGGGYPVCLFEAHEQAVVKACDRDFFYLMIQKITQRSLGVYQISKKSLKKAFVPV